MGLLYIVHRLNPDVIARVRAEYDRHPDLDWGGAVELFKNLGRLEPPDGSASSWDEYKEMFEFERWNLILTIAASERSWDLDKSLDRPGDGLPAIAKLLPELASIKTVLSAMESLDTAALPSAFQPPEMGLMGIATAHVVQAARAAASKYSQADARGWIAAAPIPWLGRLLGGAVTLSSWREDDYLWKNWLQLLEAIQEASTQGHCLGLEMR